MQLPNDSSNKIEKSRIRADDTQANAELRQAFANHLPRRIELVQKRVNRLIKGAFDINSLTILAQEVQNLAGASGRYGLVGPSERLYALEQRLDIALRDATELSVESKAELDALSQSLSNAPDAAVLVVVSMADFVPVLELMAPEHRYCAPPKEYWRRFSTEEIAPINSDDRYAGLKPAEGIGLEQTNPGVREEFEDIVINARDDDPFGELAPTSTRLPSLEIDELEVSPVSASSPTDHSTQYAPERDSSEFGGSLAKGQDFRAGGSFVRSEEPELEQKREPAPAPQAPSVQLTSSVATLRVFYLSEPNPMFAALSVKLVEMGLSVDRLESTEELVDTLSSMTADLVVIDSTFCAELDAIGEFLRGLRQRTTARMPIVALADANDLSARIRAMRSGVDALISPSASPEEALIRLKELLQQEQSADYRIMIVEDDRSQALFAESVLRKAGMETLAVTDPLRTLESLEQFRPELILMDLYMPGIDGMELTAIIRERDEFISTPIVFLSGEQDSDKQFDALSAGGDDFLSKPIRPKHLISAVTNRARRARQLKQRRESKSRDHDSGLFDRSVVIDKLAEALIVEDRSSLQGGVLFIEIDGATQLRDQLGLSGMDALTAQLGHQLKELTRSDESAARYGDGSLLVLSHSRGAQALADLARNLRTRIALQAFVVEGKPVQFNLSAGVCPFADAIAEPAAMLNCAERALAQARLQAGDDRVAIYQAPVARELTEQEVLAEAIQLALKNDDFQLMFQPIVALQDTGEEQYEVLVRLRSATGKVYSGGQLLEAAAKLGLTSEIDRWILARCMSTLDERRRRGRSGLRLFVNQTAASLKDVQRIAWLRQSLETRRLDASSICLEFRLNEMMGELKLAVPFFQSARALGLKLTLEAFESSLTALQVLSYLPVDYVKLAEKYIDATGTHREELKSLIAAAHDGGRRVIAARIESAQSAAALWSLGVDFIQGNFVQQPGAELGFDFRSTTL